MLVVPSLNEFHRTQNRIFFKSHVLQAFLSFLLQLLYHKAEIMRSQRGKILFHKVDPAVDPFQDRINSLEKELRFLLTIYGDISWMEHYIHEHDAGFQNLLPQFEAVANQASSFVHYLFFSDDHTFKEKDGGLTAVLELTDFLKDNLQSFFSIPAYTTPISTSIVDSIPILDSVVDDLEDLLKRGDNPIADVKDQVSLLQQELLLCHSSIKDMISPQPSQVELKEAVMRIGGIALQAEYLITSFLVKDAPLWYVFNRLTHLNHTIQPTRTKLQLIAQKYKFEGFKVAEYFSPAVPLPDERNTEVNGVTVGFEVETTKILYQLVGGATQTLQIISILGMAGLGKTTLANKLYNHPLVSHRFDKFSWCVVSQTYKRQSILANVLIQINNELGKERILEMEEISLVEHIHKTLMGRRYLIVLDDIWDSNVSDELLLCFPDDKNGSRILLTSRNRDVAPPNNVIHELPFFTNEQCWELLEKKAFRGRSCPPELQGIGKKMAARCGGLPLSVVLTAGILSSVDEEERAWDEVGGSLALYTNNSVMQILELSYQHLPDHLKSCFLYFGEFGDDEAISVGKLKRLWVAEGFIRKEKDKSAENIAEEYLMELIDRSLVMIAKRRKDGRGAKSCVVHDLLHELCLIKCKGESFLKYLNNNNQRTVSEKGYRLRAIGDSANLSYCQYVRSLVGDYQSNTFYVRDMRLLRVLHFETVNGFEKRLTFGIEYLVNLRFLVIQNMPIQMDKLVNLEYLRVQTRATVYLPLGIMQMKKLRYLRAESAEYGKDWNISNQTNNLEYLSGVTIKKVKDEELLTSSPCLRKLRCIYTTRGVMDKSVYPHFDLSFLTQLHSLSIIVRPYLHQVGFEEFKFPSNIRKLTLGGLGLPWEKMSMVGRLEFLEVLKLEGDAFEGARWDTRDGEFQKLRFLQLMYADLSQWNVASNEHFPKLQHLILSRCFHLQEIPNEIGEITTLELIEIEGGCLSSLVESAERIKEEQRDMGNEDLRVNTSNVYNSPRTTGEDDSEGVYGRAVHLIASHERNLRRQRRTLGS